MISLTDKPNETEDGRMRKVGRIVLDLAVTAEHPRCGESALIRLRDGAILLAYTLFGGEGGDHDHSRLYGRLSRDEGESWSLPRQLFDDDQDCRNNMSPTLIRCADGSLGLCYLRKHTMPDGTVACMPMFRRSVDEGLHWSAMSFCATESGYYCGTNAASVILSSGRIVTPVSYAGPPIRGYACASGRVIFLYSDDCGRSWFRLPGEIASPYGDAAGMMEPGLLELPDGRLWCYMRTVYGFQYQSFSEDGGVSWSIPQPNLFFSSPDAPMRVTAAGTYTVAVLNPVGRQLFSRSTLSWGGGRRTPLAAVLSKDGGMSLAVGPDRFNWSAMNDFTAHCVLLEDDPDMNYCYPAIIGTADGFLVTYYCGDNHRILRNSRVMKVSNLEIEDALRG